MHPNDPDLFRNALFVTVPLAAKGRSELAKRSGFPSVEGDEIPSCLSAAAVTMAAAVRCGQILSA